MAHNGNRGQMNTAFLQPAFDYAFMNHLKASQHWGYSDSSGRPDVAFMNAQGFPKNLNSKTWSNVFNKPTDTYRPGNWVFGWVGGGTWSIGGSSTVSGSNTNVADSSVNGRWVVTNNSQSPTWSISAIDVANPPTAAWFVHEDDEAAFLAGEVYTPLFIEKMSKAGVIRPMDYQHTNKTNVALWADNTPVDYFSYSATWWDIARDAGSTSHSGDAYSATPPMGYTRTDKCKLHVKWDFTNTTTTPTFDDGGGAKTIVLPTCAAVAAGSLVSGRRDTLTFDEGLDKWLIAGLEFDEGINAGVPIQMLVRLANDTGAHLDLSIPPMACDTLTGITDYVPSLATYLAANLNTGLKPRPQIGNELFNTFTNFYGGPYATAKGLDRWGAVGSNDANYNWHGRALSLVGAAFAAVYNDTTKYDIRMAVQSAGTPDISAVRSTIMESPRHVSDGGVAASAHVTHVCIANYWGTRSRYPSSSGTEAAFHHFLADAWEWATASADRQLELTEQFYTFENGAQTFIDGTGQDRMETWWDCAQHYGKKLTYYEGGNSEDHIAINPRCRVLGISKAAQAVVTMPSGHGFRTGMLALFKDIQGMTEINALTGGSTPEVVSYTDTTFTIDVDSTAFGTFTGGDGGADFGVDGGSLNLRGVGFAGDGVSTGRDMCNNWLSACRDSPITYLYAMKNFRQAISLADSEFPSHFEFSGDGVWSAHPPPGYIYTQNGSGEAWEHFSTNKARFSLQCVV